ncbi:hypothetical protein HPB50_014572 [Hyalomma asiaticum]|uniref:Uncharacterized protein n=1 Tax=Hyalomma asiaticum TaxID=266040 RepID=A0ACB7SNH7_HYAAI|nr:hypothetical protein HPB50_014572 [Hyalomma asiaticum]
MQRRCRPPCGRRPATVPRNDAEENFKTKASPLLIQVRRIIRPAMLHRDLDSSSSSSNRLSSPRDRSTSFPPLGADTVRTTAVTTGPDLSPGARDPAQLIADSPDPAPTIGDRDSVQPDEPLRDPVRLAKAQEQYQRCSTEAELADFNVQLASQGTPSASRQPPATTSTADAKHLQFGNGTVGATARRGATCSNIPSIFKTKRDLERIPRI